MKKVIIVFLLTLSKVHSMEEIVSGVTPEAISLPTSPGTIAGFSGQLLDSGNTGSFKNRIQIVLPKGVNGYTPNLFLDYDSSSGTGAFGQGWSINLSKIYRETKYRVPSFDNSDQFASDQNGTMVKLDFQGNTSNWYSPIINENQDLYYFSNNFWKVKKGNQKNALYGQTSNSRIGSEYGVAIWNISKEEDESGNKITYHYLNTGNNLYVDEVRYAYKDNDYKYVVKFIYNDVPSYFLSYRKGLKIVESKICTDIFVKHSNGRILKHYILDYSKNSVTDINRLISIKVKGVDDVDDSINPTPLTTFKYSNFISSDFEVIDAQFNGGNADIPKLNNKRMTNIDINGDSLVDFVETSSKGMRAWLNLGNGVFDLSYLQPDFVRTLGEKQTKLLDVDGDRIVDFVTSGLYPKYYKGGVGNGGLYSFSSVGNNIGKMPNIVYGSSGVKTVDLNGDGRLDFLVQFPNKYVSILSTAPGEWDKYVDIFINTSSFNLSSPSVFVQDFNGDGLADIGKISSYDIVYLPSLGNGTFGNSISYSFDNSNIAIFDILKHSLNKYLADFNGDGLLDLAVVNNSGFSIVFGKTNNRFSSIFSSYGSLGNFSLNGFWIGSLDINGNGVTDLVFANDDKQIKYISFVDVKPNLLTSIKNGLGKTTEISYAMSSNYKKNIEYSSSINFPVTSQVKTISYSSITIIKKAEYNYLDPFYDGDKNEFRGFKDVSVLEHGDNSQPSFLQRRSYDLGKNNYYLKGKEIFNGIYSFDNEQFVTKDLLKATETFYNTPQTFSSLENELVKNPLPFKLKYFEGDNDPYTADRVRENDIVYSFSNGYLNTKEIKEKDSSNNLYRVKKNKFSFKVTGEGSNRLCENWIFNKDLQLVEDYRYFYDSQAHCILTKGMQTLESRFTGSEFQTKRTITYYPSGSIHELYDGKNHKVTYYYDNYFINLTQSINSLGHSLVASYDSELGTMNSFTNENSHQTKINYDFLMRPTVLIGPDDSLSLPTVKYEYTFGNLSSFSSIKEIKRERSGFSATLENIKYFDSEGNNIYEITEGESNLKYRQKKFVYNTRGKITKSFNPVFVNGFNIDNSLENGFEEILYDELERKRFTYNPQSINEPTSFKEIVYKVGKQIDYDELRNPSEKSIDEFGRIVSAVDALSNTTSYVWSSRDQLSSIVDPQFSATVFRYDYQSRRICKLDPNLGVIKYFHDENDNITQKNIYGYQHGASCESTLGIPRIINYEFDSLNRKTKITYPAGSDTNNSYLNYDEASAINGVGKLTSTNYIQGARYFEYDINGFLSKESQDTTSGTFVTQFVNDLLGRVIKVIYPTIGSRSLEVNTLYSPMGKAYSVNGSGAFGTIISGVEYNPLSQITKISRSNGVEENLDYYEDDMSYRLEKIDILNTVPFKSVSKKSEKKKSSTSLLSLSYNYDEASNVIEKSDLLTAESESFSYDDLNRLISYSINSMPVQTFEYDQVGNISKLIDSSSKNYIYDNNRKQILSSVASNVYLFDGFGNISSDGVRTYSFNWDNRLKSLTKSGLTTDYIYDNDGLRTEKRNTISHNIYLNKYTEIKDTTPLYHIFMDDRRVATVDESNNLTHLHQDHLSSSILRTSSLGSNLYSQKYYPYGNERLSTGVLNNLFNLFTDQYKDHESNIYYYNERYYDPALSRFISADPLYSEDMDKKGSDSQKLNLYAYANNNPVKYTDPSGLEPPENIVPFDVAKNIQEAKDMSILEFREAVKSGGQWDYKQYGSQYQDLGNYNYGLVAKEVIPNETIIKAAAGGYQVLSHTSSFSFFNSFFDDPVDQKWIQEGMNDNSNNFWDPVPSTSIQNSTLDPSSDNFWNPTIENGTDNGTRE